MGSRATTISQVSTSRRNLDGGRPVDPKHALCEERIERLSAEDNARNDRAIKCKVLYAIQQALDEADRLEAIARRCRDYARTTLVAVRDDLSAQQVEYHQRRRPRILSEIAAAESALAC